MIWAVLVGLCCLSIARPQPVLADQAQSNELKVARELVSVMRSADLAKDVFPVLLDQLKPALTKGDPSAERDFNELAPSITAALEKRLPEFVDLIAYVYAENFAADDMRQMIAFFESPVGQKFVQKQPKLVAQSMAVGQKFGELLAADVQKNMTEELRKRGHKI